MTNNLTYNPTKYGQFCLSYRKWSAEMIIDRQSLAKYGNIMGTEADVIMQVLSKLRKDFFDWSKNPVMGISELKKQYLIWLELAGIGGVLQDLINQNYFIKLKSEFESRNISDSVRFNRFISVKAALLILKIQQRKKYCLNGEDIKESDKDENSNLTTGNEIYTEKESESIWMLNGLKIAISPLGRFCISLADESSHTAFSTRSMRKAGLTNTQISNVFETSKEIYREMEKCIQNLTITVGADCVNFARSDLKKVIDGWFKWIGTKQRKSYNIGFYRAKYQDVCVFYDIALIARRQASNTSEILYEFTKNLCFVTGRLLLYGTYNVCTLSNPFYYSQFIKDKVETLHEVRFAPGTSNYNIVDCNELIREKVNIYLYFSSPDCSKRHFQSVQCVNFLCDCMRPPYKCVINGLWCPVCNKFYIMYESYIKYAREFEIIPIKLLRDSSMKFCSESELNLISYLDGDQYDWYSNLNKQSRLAELGYSTTYSEEYRHNILRYIIDNGLMSKAQIIDWLSFLLRSRKHRLRETEIRKCDLDFVEKYNMDSQPGPIPGNIVRK